jgi:hypothetical protein
MGQQTKRTLQRKASIEMKLGEVRAEIKDEAEEDLLGERRPEMAAFEI